MKSWHRPSSKSVAQTLHSQNSMYLTFLNPHGYAGSTVFVHEDLQASTGLHPHTLSSPADDHGEVVFSAPCPLLLSIGRE